MRRATANHDYEKVTKTALKAILIHEPGQSAGLSFNDIAMPALSEPDDVLIDLRAAALNAIDSDIMAGRQPLSSGQPRVLGADGAGVVAAVGPSVAGPQLGDAVVIFPYLSCNACAVCLRGRQQRCAAIHLLSERESGTFAQFVKVPARACLPLPRGFSFTEGAAFAVTYTIAWRLLVTKGRLKPGESLLILGVGGGVGTAALQIAGAIGVRIFVTSTKPQKLDIAKQWGALDGTPSDPHELAHAVRTLTNKRGVDAVLNCVGGDTWAASLACLAKGGRLLTCGAPAGGRPQSDLRRIFWNHLQVIGASSGSFDDMQQVIRCMEQAGRRPLLDKTFPLSKAGQAHERREQRRQFGKVVLAIGAD